MESKNNFYLAKELIYKGQFKKALVLFLGSIEDLDIPESRRVLYEIANCYKNLNDVENAKKWALRSLEFDINEIEASNLLGSLCIDKKDWQNAKAWFLLSINFSNSKTNQFNCQIEETLFSFEWLAITEMYLGHPQQAKEYHLKAKSTYPDSVWLKSNDKWFNTTPKKSKKFENLKISVLVPSICRPEGLVRFYYSMKLLAKRPKQVEFIFIVEEGDLLLDRYMMLKELPIMLSSEKTTSGKFNSVLDKINGDIVLLAMDDFVMETKNWDDIIKSSMLDDMIVIGGLGHKEFENVLSFPFLTKKVIDIMGFVCPPYLNHDATDFWIWDLGHKLGRMFCLMDVRITHLHYTGSTKIHTRGCVFRSTEGEKAKEIFAETEDDRVKIAARLKEQMTSREN